MAQQMGAERQDRGRGLGRSRLQGQVALGVEARRAMVQVGRSHPQQPVVDDGDLGMDDDRMAMIR